MRHGTLEAISRKKAQTRWTHGHRLRPENRLQEQKARSNPCMVIFNFMATLSWCYVAFTPPQC
jgi:hypothetical protein